MKILKSPVVMGLLALITVYFVARITKVATWFTTSSWSNYPAIKDKERFFVSSLVKPKRFNLVCFYTNTPDFGKIMRVCRLCAISGDTVEIKNGLLFVNGDNADKALVLAHHYMIAPNDWEKYDAVMHVEEDFYPRDNRSDSFEVTLIDKVLAEHKIPARLILYPADSLTEELSQQIARNRNPDNAGPFVVPQNMYFVLGDNRLESQDSRYLGFIPERDFVATVIDRK